MAKYFNQKARKNAESGENESEVEHDARMLTKLNDSAAVWTVTP
jgi:hypothetical protein